ncbi:MAG TPA: HAD family hydrolase [Candidatus Deferrimicrobiaceae bacterium]|nr:HAD family hydrolase [Candidatus Deferrimicrobiaceae bacterium]
MARAAVRPLDVVAISLDFGNTLVRIDRASTAAVLADTARVVRERGIAADEGGFLRAWAEERDRQFREELPHGREVDLRERVVRVLARQRGLAPPPEAEHWDDPAARRLVEPAEVEVAIEAYGGAFVSRMAPVDDATLVIEQLAAAGFSLAVLSNWPLAETIERYVEVRGWLPHLRAVVVSQRVGAIKPQRAIFDATRQRLGAPAERILHVGDDWAADVIGARRAGWRAAYLRDRQGDTPLPTSRPPDETAPTTERADLVIAELAELPPLVRRWPGAGG